MSFATIDADQTAGYILCHRHRFVCWWPRIDDSGLWRHVTFAFWSWDWLPVSIGERFVAQADAMRAGARNPEQAARCAGAS